MSLGIKLKLSLEKKRGKCQEEDMGMESSGATARKSGLGNRQVRGETAQSPEQVPQGT